MAVTYKDIDLLSQKSSVAGTEKLPVSDTEYITPAQIIGKKIHLYRNATGTAARTSTPYYGSRWDVTDSSVSSYEDGMIAIIEVPVAGNGSYGTALQINSLGYKPIVYNINSMISTRYGVGSTLILVYNSTQTATLYLGSGAQTITGCWQISDYNSDTTTIHTLNYYRGNRIVTGGALYRYVLCFASRDTVIPFHSVAGSGNNASTATSKTMTTESFDPFGSIVYYATDAVVNSGSTVGSSTLYWQNPSIDFRYSTNCAKTLTSNKPVYIVASLQSDGWMKLASAVWSQSLPSTNDGYYYILLGYSYSTYQIELLPTHPIYYHDGTSLCLYTGASIPDAQVNSDWNASSGVAEILNKPSLATVATSGSYSDLSNTPTIPTISTSVTTDKTSNTKTASPKSVYDFVNPSTLIRLGDVVDTV